MKSVVVGALALGLFFTAGCAPDRESQEETVFVPPSEIPDEVREAGSKASEALGKNLQSLLQSTIQSQGPAKAIEVCQQAAMPATQAVSEQFGDRVTVGRTARKIRNPANRPDDTDESVLHLLDQTKAAGAPLPEFVVTRDSSDTHRFYRPLITREVCLTCHGDPESMPGDLRTTLAERYPEDEATGFQEGDLRGVIRVTVLP